MEQATCPFAAVSHTCSHTLVPVQDHEVLDLVQQLMPLAIWMLPLNAMVYVLDGVLVGASDFQVGVGEV